MTSALTILLSFFVGLLAWRIQLIGKRRADLAEEVLLSVGEAIDGFVWARSPTVQEDEVGTSGTLLKPEAREVVFQSRMLKNSQHNSKIRRLQLLCRFHFGEEAEVPIANLRELIDAVVFVIQHEAIIRPPSALAKLNISAEELRSVVWCEADVQNKIGRELENIQHRLEKIFLPHIRAGAALVPINVDFSAVNSWLNCAHDR